MGAMVVTPAPWNCPVPAALVAIEGSARQRASPSTPVARSPTTPHSRGARTFEVMASPTLTRALNPSLSALVRAEALVALASEPLDDITIAALLAMPREAATAAAIDHALGFAARRSHAAAEVLLQRAEALDGAAHGSAASLVNAVQPDTPLARDRARLWRWIDGVLAMPAGVLDARARGRGDLWSTPAVSLLEALARLGGAARDEARMRAGTVAGLLLEPPHAYDSTTVRVLQTLAALGPLAGAARDTLEYLVCGQTTSGAQREARRPVDDRLRVAAMNALLAGDGAGTSLEEEIVFTLECIAERADDSARDALRRLAPTNALRFSRVSSRVTALACCARADLDGLDAVCNAVAFGDAARVPDELDFLWSAIDARIAGGVDERIGAARALMWLTRRALPGAEARLGSLLRDRSLHVRAAAEAARRSGTPPST